MKKINYNNLDQNVYLFNLNNGLSVCLIPYQNKNNYYAILGTKYGSNDIEFMLDNKKIVSPYGTAHFLEHKMFEQEDGTDPMKVFSKNGASGNASTTFSNTGYYIWGVNNFYDNLNMLLELVYSPYFTDNNVSKEKGIIKEEILMYEDDPEWALDDTIRKNLFYKLPVKEKIAGTISSIDKITKEDLYNAYNTFYNPSNMYLVIGGNIEPKKIEKFLKENEKMNNIKKLERVEKFAFDEPDDVREEFQKIYKNVKVPKIQFSIKINKNKLKPFDDVKINMYLGVILTSLFGNTSDFKEDVICNNISTGYYEEKVNYNNFITLNIVGESDKADIFVDKIKEKFQNLKIKKEQLERIKKVWIASEVRMIDNVEITVDNIYSDLIQYDKLYDNRIEMIKKLDIKELQKFIKLLDLSNQCLVMVLPNDEHN